MRLVAAAAALLLWCATAAAAQTLTHGGFVEGRFALFPRTTVLDDTRAVGDVLLREEVTIEPPAWPWIRFVAGLDLRANSHAQVEAAFDFNDRRIKRPAASIRRLAATFARGPLTIDVGKQLVRWARADVLNPIDRFAPRDYLNVIDTEFLPVTGIRPSFQVGNETFEAVWTWRLTPSRMPLLDQRWTVLPPEAEGIALYDEGFRFPNRGQAGLRWRHTGGRLETGLSFFDGTNHHPYIEVTPVAPGDAVELRRTFPRLRMFAADAAVPTTWLTFKGEAAYFTSPDDRLSSYALFVLEVERQMGEWLLTAGYAGETDGDALPAFAFDPERAIAPAIVGRAAYTVDPRRTVAVELAARQNGDGVYVKGDFSQAFGQRWRATVTGVVLAGDEDDFLGQFDRNSHVTTALRFSF